MWMHETIHVFHYQISDNMKIVSHVAQSSFLLKHTTYLESVGLHVLSNINAVGIDLHKCEWKSKGFVFSYMC